MNQESEDIFVKQLQENQNIIHKICRLYTSDDDSHKDLFQEITIQLWKAFPKFRGDSKFTTWAYRVGLNTAITLYRKKKRTISTIEFDNTFHKVKQEDYNFEEEEQLKLLYSAVGELNDIEKALVFLYLEEWRNRTPDNGVDRGARPRKICGYYMHLDPHFLRV